VHTERKNATNETMDREYLISHWWMGIKRRQQKSAVKKIHQYIYAQKMKNIYGDTELMTFYICNEASKEILPKSGDPAHCSTVRIESFWSQMIQE
jgi:hypothetical protein